MGPRLVRVILGLAALALLATGGLAEEEIELRQSANKLAKLLESDPARVEVGAEIMRKSYPYGVRLWLVLAKARLAKPDSVWAAQVALDRVAELGDEGDVALARTLASKHGLRRPPERVELVGMDALRERAAGDACEEARRIAREAGCPIRKVPFGTDGEGLAACAFHPRPDPDRPSYRIPEDLLLKALASQDPWLQLEAVRHSDAAGWSDRVLQGLLGKTDSALRHAALFRLLGAGARRSFGKLDQRVASAWLPDPSPGVWEYAARLLAAVRKPPYLSPARIADLIRRFDDGGSWSLAEFMILKHRESVQAACRQILLSPVPAGQMNALMLLQRGMEPEARIILSALERDPPPLRELRGFALHSMAFGAGQHYGDDLSVWREKLGTK